MRFYVVLLAAALSGCLTDVPAPRPERAGSFSDFLTPNQAVHLQIDFVPDRAPSELATRALLEVAGEIGVKARVTSANRLPNQETFTFEELDYWHRTLYAGNPTTWRGQDGAAVLHILYASGYAENESLAGFKSFATGTPLVVVFMDHLAAAWLRVVSTDALSLSQDGIERAVLVHEFGHVLGLVNCDLPQVIQRHDDEHPCHSLDKNSTMYWAVHNAEDPTKWILDDEMQPIWKFSADDWADIRAFQEKLAQNRQQSAASPQSYTPPLSPTLSKSATKRSLGVD